MRLIERAFVKNKGSRERGSVLKQEFLVSRNKFDKLLRSTEREYKRGLMINIEADCTSNPREFWDHLKSLGPKRKHTVPYEVYDEDGNVRTDSSFVDSTWTRDFSNLYNAQNTQDFDYQFYDNMLQHKRLLEDNMKDPLYDETRSSNIPISRDEIEKVVFRAKNGKSVGPDKIPYEILKFPSVIDALYSLFNFCLDSGLIPSIWRKAIITPIPKDSTKDPRIPLNYRGISLLCAVSKLYSSVLNARLLPYLENNGLLVDEQNGFRSGRSCQDHVFSACTVIRDRLSQKKSTFATFIDLQKAFDFVDRDALLYKLLVNKIDGKFYNSVKVMYTNTEASVKLNGSLSNWFPCTSGVKQGDNLSPTLFALFINDLAEELKTLNSGIFIDNVHICCLLYADDLMLVSDTEGNMQRMLDCVSNWCNKWRLRVNYTKSAIIHFRNKGKRRSDFAFHIGNTTIEYVSSYKYLGVVLCDNMDFNATADALFNSGGIALGSMISKIHNFKDVGFETYTKLYNSCVTPVTDYCSGVWGFRDFNKSDMVQNRAIRYFLGVHRFTPILAINGDMGWPLSLHRRWINMLRLWNRLIDMDNNRLTKKIFLYDFQKYMNNSWCSEIKFIFDKLGLAVQFYNMQRCDINMHEKLLFRNYSNDWTNKTRDISKLRTYITFKTEYNTEDYVKAYLPKQERSFLAQLRCGVLPLRIETGRFSGLKPEERVCQLCDSGEIEDEKHFILTCDRYTNQRQILFRHLNPSFYPMDSSEKLQYLLTQEYRHVAKYITQSFLFRRKCLYN